MFSAYYFSRNSLLLNRLINAATGSVMSLKKPILPSAREIAKGGKNAFRKVKTWAPYIRETPGNAVMA